MGELPEADIWAQVFQIQLVAGSTRLIVIRNAEKLKQWHRLDTWLGFTRQIPGIYLVFVSNETTLGVKGAMPAHLSGFKAPRGSAVKCSLPKEEDALAWVRRRAGLDDSTARHLLTRTGGNLTVAAQVCAKLALFAGQAGTATIDALVQESPAADFSDSLIALDRKRALLCIPDLSWEASKLIALLDSRLDVLHTLHRAQIAGHGWRDSSVNPYLARKYLPHARHYDTQKCAYRRRVLAVVDDALRSGAHDGVFEALVALW